MLTTGVPSLLQTRVLRFFNSVHVQAVKKDIMLIEKKT